MNYLFFVKSLITNDLKGEYGFDKVTVGEGRWREVTGRRFWLGIENGIILHHFYKAGRIPGHDILCR